MYLYGSRLAALLTPALVMLAAAGCSSASTGDAPTASANSAVQNGAPPQMSTGQSDVLRKRYISTIELRNDSAAVAIVKANSAKTQPVVGGDGLTFAEIVTEATVVKTLRGSLTGKTVNIVQLGDSGSDSEAPPLQQGRTYLVFLMRATSGDAYVITGGMGSYVKLGDRFELTVKEHDPRSTIPRNIPEAQAVALINQ